MKILVDENIPLLCVNYLQDMGHEVVDIRGTEEEGLSDEAVWNKAQRDGCLLITTDNGAFPLRSMAWPACGHA